MKKLFIFLVLLTTIISCLASNSKVKIYAYPALIYDNGHCSIYQNYMTDISFHFFYVDKKVSDLKSSGTKFYISLPEEITLIEAGVMDGWKKTTGIYSKFNTKKEVINNRKYIRYQLPIPTSVIQPALKKPLPGGMFGGTTNNLVNLMIKPNKVLPKKSMIYWETVGKYAYKGQFSVYPVTLDVKNLNKSRIVIHSFSNLPAFAYSRNAVAEQVRLFKDLKIDSIDSQLASGANKGFKDLWDKGGFGVHGGSSLMHVFWHNPNGIDKGQKIEDRDFLTGIDNRNSRYISKQAYHQRAFCPQAIITKGRYPYKKLLKLGKDIAASGATWLDIDIEADLCIQCYCQECRDAFFKFSKLKAEKLSPEQLVRKYPKEWYYFRNEQTRLLYQTLKDNLKKQYPNLKIGANTVLHNWGKDLGNLKYGYCSFAEDPRLMTGTLEYIMADTLMGGIYDGITIDAMSKATNIPIIAIPGSSYCVGYSAGVMCGRRMTSEMTGCTYGYEQRYENHFLSMLHIAASGASGLRYGINEACIAKATVDAMKIIAQVDDFYLDGKRIDDNLAVADLTKGTSNWGNDKSRIRGGIWKYFYDKWCGQVQSRFHTLNNEYVIGLYNWDPWQDKKWHVRIKDIPKGKWYLTEISTGKQITLKGKNFWTNDELKKGFIIDIKKINCQIIKITKQQLPVTQKLSLECVATNKKPYNQYAWRTGGQHDFNKIIDTQLKRPLALIKLYGKSIQQKNNANVVPNTVIKTTINAKNIPLKIDLTNAAKFGINAIIENNAIVSKNNYYFASMVLPIVKENLLFTIKANGNGANLGVQLYNMQGKRLQIPLWNKVINSSNTISFVINAKYLQQTTKIMFYSIGKKNIVISSINVAYTKSNQVTTPITNKIVPTVKIPFQLDFTKNQVGINIEGIRKDKSILSTTKYAFGSLYIPASLTPLHCKIDLKTKDDARFGIILYELNNRNLAGKIILRPTWAKRFEKENQTISFTIPPHKKTQLLCLYNTSKKGTITIKKINLGFIK